MKKIAILLLIIIAVGLSACTGETVKNSEEATTSPTTIAAANSNDETLNVTAQNVTEKTENDVGGGEIVQEKYRQCYYNISYQLSLLVDEDELKAWEEETYSKDPNETNEMVVKLFVQHFNISKEDFERANLEAAKVLYDPSSPPPSMNPKDYINQEMFELYNADIIYTFDDEIINEYYLSGYYPFTYESEYEEAIANGTYQSQTEKWIDIEQMEAEINAKYGVPDTTEATDAVTQTTAAIPEDKIS